MFDDWSTLLRVSVLGLLLVIITYATVRGASWAFYRSKLEAWRTMRKEMKEGERRDGF